MEIEKASPISITSTYSHLPEYNIVSLKVRIESIKKFTTDNKYILIILDISGSMSGSKLNTCKETITELYDYCFNNLNNQNIDMLLFNTCTEYLDLSNKKIEDITYEIQKIHSRGGTSFKAVFNELDSLLTKKKKENYQDIVLILLSDGQAESVNELNPYIQKAKKFLADNFLTASFHTLGYGTDHDATLLSAMVNCGSTQGTFQYVKEFKQIKTCIDSIAGSLGEKTFKSELIVNGKEHKLNFLSEKLDSNETKIKQSWEGVHPFNLTEEEFKAFNGQLKLRLTIDNPIEYDLNPKFKEPDNRERLKTMYSVVNSKLKSIGGILTDNNERKSRLDTKEVQKFNNEINDYRKMLVESKKLHYKLKINERDELIQLYDDLQEYASKLNEVIHKAVNQNISNQDIAEINSLAYRDITKQNLLKKLDKRAIKNADMINEIMENVKEIKHDPNSNLQEKYKDLIPQYGNCFMNLIDFVEAIQTNDCLCLTFDLIRPESAIVDPSRIIIKSINPTIICASAFLDSVKYALKLDINKSGGFVPNNQIKNDQIPQGELMKGASNDVITAAIPFYICPEHWTIASQLIKPLLGWVTTLNTLGYDNIQLKTIPFMLLDHAHDKLIKEGKNEFNLRIYNSLLETCYMIIKEDLSFKAHLMNTWKNYLTKGTLRTVTSIPNNTIFLAQILCMIEKALIEQPDKNQLSQILARMIEEDMRRKQNKDNTWNSASTRKNILKILDIDPKKIITELENILKNEIQPASIDMNIEEESKTTKKNKQKIALKPITPTAEAYLTLSKEDIIKDNKPNPYQESCLKEFYHNFKRAIIPFRKWYSLWLPDVIPSEKQNVKTDDIGLISHIQIFTCYIQNQSQFKNDDRNQAFENGTYVDPWDEQQCLKSLNQKYRDIIWTQYCAVIYKKSQLPSINIEELRKFAYTNDLDDAASLVKKGFDLRSLQILLNILRKECGNCKMVYEKLMMLKHKEYKHKNLEVKVKLLKRNIRKLYKKYQDTYTYDAWKELWYKKKQQGQKKSESENVNLGGRGRGRGRVGRGRGRMQRGKRARPRAKP